MVASRQSNRMVQGSKLPNAAEVGWGIQSLMTSKGVPWSLEHFSIISVDSEF